jgi:glycosyltransferase involved in cell wall biosynthesis
MKILFVSSGNKKGGLNPIIDLQSKSLAGYKVEISHFLIFGNGFFGYIPNILKLRNFLKRNKIDIIHAHFGFCGIVSLLSKKDEKLIVSLMGDDVLGAKDSKGVISFKKKMILKINYYFAVKFYDYVIVKSEEMRNKLLSREDSISIIPNGVDQNIFFEIKKETAIETVKWDKNLFHLIFLSDPQRPEKNFKLVQRSVEMLKNEGYLVELHVVFNVQTDNLKYIYSAADVLLMSSFHEGSPNVIKEAMSCNCPIVYTNVGDIKWLVNGLEGCFLSSFDVEEYKEKIKEALIYSTTVGRTKGFIRVKNIGVDSVSISSKLYEIYHSLFFRNKGF